MPAGICSCLQHTSPLMQRMWRSEEERRSKEGRKRHSASPLVLPNVSVGCWTKNTVTDQHRKSPTRMLSKEALLVTSYSRSKAAKKRRKRRKTCSTGVILIVEDEKSPLVSHFRFIIMKKG